MPEQRSDVQDARAGMQLNRYVTWAEVDLDAIAWNVQQLKGHVGQRTELMAVVKANAYGHGTLPVARVALQNGATRLAIGRVDEAIKLRKAGIGAPILLMCYTTPAQSPDIVRYRLTPTVNALEQAQALSQAVAAQGRTPLPIHIKVDTGMGRFGLMPEEVLDFARAVAAIPGLALEGFYTHFATADEVDTSDTRRQFALYTQLVQQLAEASIPVPVKHVANSAATMRFPEMHLDMVRCGIAMYGLYPCPDMGRPLVLRPAMALKSRVGRVRTLPAGWAISYGRTHVTTQPTPVALVPAGYGDGYHRALSNKGAVLIRGQRAPILGRVCMDQLVVDVTGILGIEEGEPVVLLGRQGEGEISADQVAAWAGTINYEVVTAILPRVARIYLEK